MYTAQLYPKTLWVCGMGGRGGERQAPGGGLSAILGAAAGDKSDGAEGGAADTPTASYKAPPIAHQTRGKLFRSPHRSGRYSAVRIPQSTVRIASSNFRRE